MYSNLFFPQNTILLLSEKRSPSIMIPAWITSRGAARETEEVDIEAPGEMADVALILSILCSVGGEPELGPLETRVLDPLSLPPANQR